MLLLLYFLILDIIFTFTVDKQINIYYYTSNGLFVQTNHMERVKVMTDYKLFDAEYKFMSIIWEHEPIKSTELSKMCLDKLGWKKPTTFNMIRKLSERGLIQNESATVTTLVKQEEIQQYESHAVIEKAFKGSLPAFLTAFLGEKKLTEKEALELKRIIEEQIK